MPVSDAGSLPALLPPKFLESPLRIRQESHPSQKETPGVPLPASNIFAPNRSSRCRTESRCNHRRHGSSPHLAVYFLAGHDAANGFAVRFTRTATGKDLFKVPHLLGLFPIFQGTKPRPNHFGTVVVTSRLDHLVDEVLPVIG